MGLDCDCCILQVIEILVEESNVQPVNSPVTVCCPSVAYRCKKQDGYATSCRCRVEFSLQRPYR